MKMRFRFEDLEVWREARGRASISVSSNIAEGSGRISDRDFAHFLKTAYGSRMEAALQLFLAFDEEYMDETMLDAMLEKARIRSAKIASLNRSLLVKASKVAVRPPSTFDPLPSTIQ